MQGSKQLHRLLLGIALLLSVTVYFVEGYFLKRSQTAPLVACFGILFSMCPFLALFAGSRTAHIVLMALLLRLPLLLLVPNLSDDAYRFIWDGRIVASRENPYDYTPTEYLRKKQRAGVHSCDQLYLLLNNLQRENYSCYPPLNEYVFGAASLIAPSSLNLNLILLRVIILACDVLTIVFLIQLMHLLQKPIWLVTIYAFNPLVVVELIGNLHFEGVQLLFLVPALLLLLKKNILSGSLWGMATSIKLLPLLFVPLCFRFFGLKKGFFFVCLFFITFLFLAAPVLSTRSIAHFASSIKLFQERFEFNGSIFYLARAQQMLIYGYDRIKDIAPVLRIVFLSLAALLYFKQRKDDLHSLLKHMIWLLTSYFLLSSVVHPWYITTLVCLSVVSLQIPVVIWSFLVMLSYSAYHSSPVKEQSVMLLIEYGILASSWLFYFLGLKTTNASNT